MGTVDEDMQMRAETLVAGLIALPFSLSLSYPRETCSCNGFINDKGQGECQTTFKGKQFCYLTGVIARIRRGDALLVGTGRMRHARMVQAHTRTAHVKGRSRDCCTPERPCRIGEGDCDSDDDCGYGLKCGDSNCAQFRPDNSAKANCCYNPRFSSYYWGTRRLRKRMV